jgi:hypothetical protein
VREGIVTPSNEWAMAMAKAMGKFMWMSNKRGESKNRLGLRGFEEEESYNGGTKADVDLTSFPPIASAQRDSEMCVPR